MSRDQRARDNWALLFAQDTALAVGRPLVTVFCLAPSFLGATVRQYDFMLRGLEETARLLEERQIPVRLLEGEAGEEIPLFVERVKAHSLVTDFDPLRIKRRWRKEVATRIGVAFDEVDAHNIIPCRVASPKQEFAARTFRPRVRSLLPEYLEKYPPLRRHPHRWRGGGSLPDWKRARSALALDVRVPPVTGVAAGPEEGMKALRRFLRTKLAQYGEARNDPARDGQSGLSPWLHFGQLSPQRVAFEVSASDAPREAREAFLEELVVRRELADNFCWHQEAYDSVEGFPGWAQKTLHQHRRDPRPRLYGLADLEAGRTDDPLWNAAQREMVFTGRMHGYLRMYWGKKILGWTKSPEEALARSVELNDRYQLDGRDPNGYAGIAWCIGGVHDRPWPPRPVFGTVRSMTFEGCRRKFDINGYITRVEALARRG
jgi:deoxyribodipyrimidine photo-lyase